MKKDEDKLIANKSLNSLEEELDKNENEEEEEEEEEIKKEKIKKPKKKKKKKKKETKKKKKKKSKIEKMVEQNFSISNIEFSKSDNNSSENKEIKKLELFKNGSNSSSKKEEKDHEEKENEEKENEEKENEEKENEEKENEEKENEEKENEENENEENENEENENEEKEQKEYTESKTDIKDKSGRKSQISHRGSLLDSSIFNDKAAQIKVEKQSKHLNIIRKFHNIYEKLSGKTFVVETSFHHEGLIEYYKKIINIEILISLSAFLSILTGIVYYEKTYVNNEEKPKHSDTLLLYFLHLQTILFFLAIILKEKTKLKADIEAKNENEGSTLINTSRYIRIIIYLIFFGLHPSPMFQKIRFTEKTDEYVSPYSLNSIILVFVLLRSYFIVRPFLFMSQFMDIEAQYSCRQYSFKNSLLFCLKCHAQYSPIKLYISGFILILFTMAYAVRIFERPANDALDNYIDALWLIVITMTTVGYGDITAKTTGGRIVSMISCLSGVFLTSMIIVTITNFLNLEPHEKRMLENLEKTDALEDEKELAKNIIQKYIGIVKKYCNGFNYNKIMSDYKTIRPLKDTIKELNTNQSNKSSPYSREFITLSNRIEFFIDFQSKIMEKRLEIYEKMKQLDLRITLMRDENIIS